jgi:hypothetical protein
MGEVEHEQESAFSVCSDDIVAAADGVAAVDENEFGHFSGKHSLDERFAVAAEIGMRA